MSWGTEGDTDLLHVGHSSFDGGRPFGQFVLWQTTTVALILVYRYEIFQKRGGSKKMLNERCGTLSAAR